MKICKVKDCDNEYNANKGCARKCCAKHYAQLKRYGKIFERTKYTSNEIIDKGDYCEMVLYSGLGEQKEVARTLFSKRHLEKVKQYKWCISSAGYCKTMQNRKTYFLHHFIKGKPPKGLVTDHINQNKLDNRDENLRFATYSENTLNSKQYSTGFEDGKHEERERILQAMENHAVQASECQNIRVIPFNQLRKELL